MNPSRDSLTPNMVGTDWTQKDPELQHLRHQIVQLKTQIKDEQNNWDRSCEEKAPGLPQVLKQLKEIKKRAKDQELDLISDEEQALLRTMWKLEGENKVEQLKDDCPVWLWEMYRELQKLNFRYKLILVFKEDQVETEINEIECSSWRENMIWAKQYLEKRARAPNNRDHPTTNQFPVVTNWIHLDDNIFVQAREIFKLQRKLRDLKHDDPEWEQVNQQLSSVTRTYENRKERTQRELQAGIPNMMESTDGEILQRMIALKTYLEMKRLRNQMRREIDTEM
ncbi:hypothetical protein EDC01DRAFT_680805 [Geopyxis carbonaria]|nr:hypothetical protein EDC01DRAFT_680805 [Geopyxis carbonaria]